MIFSSQLGLAENQTDREAIKSIANHIRKLQEELEYRLGNLASSNITEIDAESTSIKSGSENVNDSIHRLSAAVISLGESVSSLAMRVAALESAQEG